MIENVESPFKIVCKSGLQSSKPFNFSNMMDTDRTYYYLNGSIGNFKISRQGQKCANEYKSRFENVDYTEKCYLQKINVLPKFENKGIMTIIFCDMMLCIFEREMAYRSNIELKLVNTSKKCRDKKIVNVYQSVLPGYELSKKQSKHSRLVLEKLTYLKDLKLNYYKNIFYLFPLKTRESDIHYFKSLRNEKLSALDISKIKSLQ